MINISMASEGIASSVLHTQRSCTQRNRNVLKMEILNTEGLGLELEFSHHVSFILSKSRVQVF